MNFEAYNHNEYNRKVLLCVIGLTPQIITETIYALAHSEKPFHPTELKIITTTEGYDRLRLTLVGDQTGYLAKLIHDYALPKIDFDLSRDVHVLVSENGERLNDIRTDEDNEQLANLVTKVVAELTKDNDTKLHVSIAGGRKTMGYYAGYALSLFGRPQDELSHVLVSTPFESHRDFYYPTPYNNVIYSWPDKLPLDTKEAVVSLAKIPYVRIRHELPKDLLNGTNSFSQTVAKAQIALAPMQLVINIPTRMVSASGTFIQLKDVDFTFLWLLASRRKSGKPGIHYKNNNNLGEEFLGFYEQVVGKNSGHYVRVEKHIENDGMTKDFYDARSNAIKEAFEKVLTRETFERYCWRRSNNRYEPRSLNVDPNSIEILLE